MNIVIVVYSDYAMLVHMSISIHFQASDNVIRNNVIVIVVYSGSISTHMYSTIRKVKLN